LTVSIRILALEKDLFFAVKMRDTLRHHDIEVTTVRTLPAFEQQLALSGDERPVLAIVNTATRGVDWEAAIRQARAQGLPVLAFGSHMDLEARAKALQAGAGKVVANSKFSSDMPGLVTRMLAEAVTTPVDESDEG
jgi:DNA-binding response OmpR family regulator